MSYWIEKKPTTAGVRYYVTTRLGGKKIYAAAGKKREDAVKLRKILEERALRTTANPYGIDLTLEQLQTSYLEHSKTKRDNTQKYIKYGTDKFIEYSGPRTLVKNISHATAEKFKQELLNKEHDPNGVNMILSACSAMFQYAIKMEWMEKNPFRSIKIKVERTAKFLNKTEIDLLLLKGCAYNKELKKVIKVALYTGMRLSEIASINRENVQGNFIDLKNTKTGNPRRIPIHDEIKGYLPLKGWTKWRIERAFRRAVVRSNLNGIRFHDLRHTFCSNYLQSGGTIADLREISGHKSLQSLQIYMHFQPNFLQQRIQNYRIN